MAQQSRSSQPTIRQDLQRSPALNPGIRASGLYSYTEARPSYIDRDRTVGAGMEILARSLSRLDSSLVPALERINDRNIERAVTQGAELYAQNTDLDKNRKNWKDFVEENPQDSPYNPYLQIGYEQARLKALAVDQAKAMEDAFVQSGMVNETDQKKVKAWMDDFAIQFRKDNHLDTYEDKLTLAENFSANEFKTKAGMMAKHSQYVARQNESRTMQQFSELTAKQIEAMFDPSLGGSVFGAGEADAQRIADIIMTNGQTALANGVLDANAAEMYTRMVFDAYERLDKNPVALKALDLVKTPGGVALSSLPGVAEKVNALQRQRIEQARADQRHYWAMEERQKKLTTEQWMGQGVMAWGDKPPTKANMDAAGVPVWLQPAFAQSVNSFNKSMMEGQRLAPASQAGLTAVHILSSTGQLTQDEVLALSTIYGADKAKEWYDTNKAAQDETNKDYTSFLKEVSDDAESMFSRKKGDVLDLSSIGFGYNKELYEEQMVGLRAKELAISIAAQKVEEYKASHNGAMPDKLWYTMNKHKALSETGSIIAKEQEGKQAGVTVPGADKKASPPAPTAPQPNTAAPKPTKAYTMLRQFASNNGINTATLPPPTSSPAEVAGWMQKNHPEQVQAYNAFCTSNR